MTTRNRTNIDTAVVPTDETVSQQKFSESMKVLSAAFAESIRNGRQGFSFALSQRLNVALKNTIILEYMLLSENAIKLDNEEKKRWRSEFVQFLKNLLRQAGIPVERRLEMFLSAHPMAAKAIGSGKVTFVDIDRETINFEEEKSIAVNKAVRRGCEFFNALTKCSPWNKKYFSTGYGIT